MLRARVRCSALCGQYDKNLFSEQFGETKKIGLHEAIERVGLRLAGTHHRGIDDARNIARLLPWIVAATLLVPKATLACDGTGAMELI